MIAGISCNETIFNIVMNMWYIYVYLTNFRYPVRTPIFQHMGVSINGGTPKWLDGTQEKHGDFHKWWYPKWMVFVGENPIYKWDENWGDTRGVEKQGLFGTRPCGRFFSHADDQKKPCHTKNSLPEAA